MANAALNARQQAKSVVRKLTGSLGSRIDELNALREKKRALEAQVAELEHEYRLIEEELLETLGKQGLEKASGSTATVSVSTSVVADVQDWDALNAFIKKSGYFHLYQRRISEPAFRELLEQKGAVPGISPFTKRKLSLRAT